MILKNDKKDIKSIVTTKGMLTIERTVLRPADKTGLEKLLNEEDARCVVPLDIVLGIDVLPFKMTREMMCEVAFWAQNQSSFKAAEGILKKVYGVSVVSETVRRIADYVGKIIFDEDTQNAEMQYSNIAATEHTKDKDGVLYIQLDGATLNTRQQNDSGSTWRENKLGVVFSSDNIVTRINKKGEKHNTITRREYTSYLGGVGQFKKHLYSCAAKNGYGKYKTAVVISDGAPWIRKMCDEVFPDAVQVLDLFHLCENTYEYAKAIFKNDEAKFKPWAEDIIGKFKASKADDVVGILMGFQGCKLPKGTVDLLTYVNNNYDRIDYKQYSEKGYFVGSGAIESANKAVLQKRLRLSGMRWNENTAQYLLSLRAKLESGLWNECVIDKISSCSFEKCKVMEK